MRSMSPHRARGLARYLRAFEPRPLWRPAYLRHSARDYVYLVPFVEDENTVFLKTIIPSRKATKQYLGEESDMKLEADEKELLDSVERGEWKPAKGGKRERAR
jgi:hypothetical protein